MRVIPVISKNEKIIQIKNLAQPATNYPNLAISALSNAPSEEFIAE
jgi:hypothetical protein